MSVAEMHKDTGGHTLLDTADKFAWDTSLIPVQRMYETLKTALLDKVEAHLTTAHAQNIVVSTANICSTVVSAEHTYHIVIHTAHTYYRVLTCACLRYSSDYYAC